MNPTQLQTTLAPLVTLLGGLLAVKVPFFDAGTWGQILGGILTLGGIIWAGVATRQSAIISTVANDPQVKSVQLTASAPQGLVDATPQNVQK
jgi:hypothetical protein